MDEITLHLLNGISYGMILFLIASGLSLILGVMGILNLAHGSLYLFGAYIGLTLAQSMGNFWLVALLSGLAVGVVGLVVERVFLSRVHGQFDEQTLLTLGLVYISANLFLWIWGPWTKIGNSPQWLASSVSIGDHFFPLYRFAVIVIGLLIFGGLWWFQQRTRAGAIVRAGMEDKIMVQGLGINYALVSSAVFFLGTFIGGFTGYLSVPWLGAEPNMGFPILLMALISVIIGGLGTVQGTLLGAMVIRLINYLGKAFIPEMALFLPHIAFLVVLVTRPYGLLGRKT